MIHLTKLRLAVFTFASIAILVLSYGCKKTQSDQSNPTGQPATATNNTNNSSGPAARLDRFVGDWGSYCSRSSAVSGKIGLDSRFMKTKVKKTSGDSILVEGDIWMAKGILRYDSNSQKYLLSFSAEDFPGITEVPMTFSETDGFAGETTFKNGGKEAKATATIKDDKGASDWQIKLTQGKDFWSLHIRLGKDQ